MYQHRPEISAFEQAAPIGSNDAPAGRRANRRVGLEIVPAP